MYSLDAPTTVAPRSVSKTSRRAVDACGECQIDFIGGPHDRNTKQCVQKVYTSC